MGKHNTPNDIFFFFSKVSIEDKAYCWLWNGSKDRYGYGKYTTSPRFGSGKKSMMAYKYAYELMVQPVPDGLVLDHLCRNPQCVNPTHLEAVTQGENVKRGLVGDLKTHCRNGHELTPENSYSTAWKKRGCYICKRTRNKKYRLKRSGAINV